MKTAMQELIEFIDYEFGFKWDDDTNQKFKELLEKEKEQIIDAFLNGDNSDCTNEQNSFEFAEKYYNQTYNQNK